MRDRQEAHGRGRPQQLVVAIAVGRRLHGQLQCLGYLQDRRTRSLGATVQKVHDVNTGDDLLALGHGARLAHGLKPIESDHREDVHELAIPVGVLGQALPQSGHGRRQVPVLERRPVAQCPRLTLQRRHVVPGVIQRTAALEAAGVLANHLSIAEHHDPLGIGANGGDLPDIATFHAVAVALEVHQARR